MTTKTIEIPCNTTGSCESDDQMFICRRVMEDLFEGEWFRKKFVAVLQKATLTSRRPLNALKIKIPHDFVNRGINVEQPDGRFLHQVLTFRADDWIIQNKLKGKTWWVRAEFE